MKNFVAIDFETANKHYICAVGIVCVQNAQIIDTYHSLVQPPYNDYNPYHIQVHGITQSDTMHAATFIKIYPEIKKRLAHQIVVAHNEAFDRNVLKKNMLDNQLNYSELNIADRWECTMKLCRANPKYQSAKLNECCAIEGIQLKHHEALSDAKACAELYLKLNMATT